MKLRIDSFCVKEVKDTKTTKPHILPLYMTTAYEFESIQEGMDIFLGNREGHVYSRYGNPTVESVAQKLADLEVFGSDEDAYAQFCSSGMSAISTALTTFLQAGDGVLTQGNLYGGSTELVQKVLKRQSIEAFVTDLTDLKTVKSLLESHDKIKVIYIETPANPTLSCIDLEEISKLCKEFGVLSICDNTFCTAYIQQPLLRGIDIVVHSTTKYYNGHGTGMGGVIISKDEAKIRGQVYDQVKLLGTNANPMDAWLVHNGLKTLSLRMDRHGSNALNLARFLEGHPKVKKVNYPGLESHSSHMIAKQQMRNYGGMMSFELLDGIEAGKKLMDKLNLCVLAPTLGNVDTLVLHPASMSHIKLSPEQRASYDITDGLVRVSVGIEHIEDLTNDFEQALE